MDAGNKGFFDKIEMIIRKISHVLLIIMVIVVSIQVVGRYAFSKSPSWSEEIARLTLIWMTFLGATVAVKRRRHFMVDLIRAKLPDKMLKLLLKVDDVLWVAFSLGVLYSGYLMLSTTWNETLPATLLPMWIYHLAAPFMGLLVIFFSIKNCFIRSKLEKGGVAKEDK